MRPHSYKRNFTRSLWDCASTSYGSVGQLPLLVKSKQPHWWQFRAVWLKMFSRFAKTHLSTQWASRQRELSESGLAGPGPGVALPCVWEPGTVWSWHSSRFQKSICVSVCHHSAPWCVGTIRGSICVYFCTMSCSRFCKPSVFSGLWVLNQSASYLL